MRALLLRKEKKEVDKRQGRGGKGRGRHLPDQYQSASYAPDFLYRFSHVLAGFRISATDL